MRAIAPRSVTRATARAVAGLFAGMLAGAPDAAHAADRLPTDVVPTRQTVSLRLDPAQRSYTGSVTIELGVREPAHRVRFHGEGLVIERVALRAGDAPGRSGDAARAGAEIGVRAAPDSAGMVTLHPARPLEPGAYRLDIAFSNAFDTLATSLYRLDHAGHAYAFTQFEADDARRAFPCWDEPSFKIPWRVSLTVPAGQLAIANSRAVHDTTADGWRTVTFAETPPLPSYLVAFAAGPLDTLAVPGTRVPCRIVTVRGATALAGEAARAIPPLLAALERWFEGPYPYDKLDLLAVPQFWFGAMENPGAIAFADRRLLLDPAAATDDDRHRLTSIIAHELAHMWFGDFVTMAWWDDLWLNESFATWLGNRVTDEVRPAAQRSIAVLEGRRNAMRADARSGVRAMRQPVAGTDNLLQLADALAYQKGRSVLEMFERWLGPEVFRDGVLDYLDAHAWGNATGHDLWEALSDAQHRGPSRAVPRRFDAGDVARALPTFLDQPGIPLVTVERVGGDKVRISQRRYRRAGEAGDAGPDPPLWRIPVSMAWGEGAVIRTRTVLLAKREMTVRLDGGATFEWIHPNAGESGYYRWAVDPALLGALVDHAARLSTRERAALPDHLEALLDAGLLPGDEFLAVLETLLRDPEPAVVRSALAALGAARASLVEDGASDAFAAWARRALRPAFDRHGPAARPDDGPGVAALRAELLESLADWGDDPRAAALGDSLARALLDGRTVEDASLAAVAPRIAARRGDRALFDACVARFGAARSPLERSRWLSALGRFRDPALVEEALRWSLDAPLRPQEALAIPVALSNDAETRERAWRFVEERWDWIAARVPPALLGNAPRFAGGCSPDRIERARRFFADPAHQGSGWRRTLDETAEDVAACATVRAREAARVAAWLRAGAALGD
jgi:alanyl aminopeptidase